MLTTTELKLFLEGDIILFSTFVTVICNSDILIIELTVPDAMYISTYLKPTIQSDYDTSVIFTFYCILTHESHNA